MIARARAQDDARRLVAVVAMVAGVLVAPGARALTQIDFISDPGDYIGAGLTFSLTPADGTIIGSTGFPGLNINFNGPGGGVSPKTFWFFSFAPRTGDPLGPGNYWNAERASFHSPMRPGLDIFGDGRGCNTLTGRFTIHELSLDGGGNVISFAADAEQHCEGLAPALRVRIRINSSVPMILQLPQSIAGYPQSAYERALVTLDGSNSYDPNGQIVAFQWSQIAGPVPTLETSNAAATRFRAPDVPAGGADLTFRLDVADNSGNHAQSDVVVHVYDRHDRRTLLTWRSPLGDYIGGGIDLYDTPEDGTFTFAGFAGNTGAEVNFNGSTFNSWGLDFMAPSGALLPGTYLGAQRYPFQPPGTPGLSVSGSGRGCNTLTGQFTVMEVDFALKHLGVRFEQSCEGVMPALKGTVLFNAIAPGDPVARMSAPVSVPARQSFTLDGSASSSAGSALVSYKWRHLGGPPVDVSGAGGAVLQAIAACKGKQRFELEVGDQDGLVDYVVADVDVTSPPPALAAAQVGLYRQARALFLLDWNFDHVPDQRAIFGASTDKPLIGDFNADGFSDLVVYRSGVWYVDLDRNGVADGVLGFGGDPVDIPLVADMNCDGVADLVIYRNGVWYVDSSLNGTADAIYGFGGAPGDVPLVGDLDGDGRQDLIIYRNGVWFADFDRNGTADAIYGFGGAPGDIPLVFDFDGDGRDDLVIFRNGVWYVSTNRDGNASIIFGYGTAGDLPVAGHWK